MLVDLFGKFRTCQFICYVVYNVGVVQPPSLVLPPALDVDARLSLEIRQVEVVSDDTKKYIFQKRLRHRFFLPPCSRISF